MFLGTFMMTSLTMCWRCANDRQSSVCNDKRDVHGRILCHTYGVECVVVAAGRCVVVGGSGTFLRTFGE